jgi:hypothetical protein
MSPVVAALLRRTLPQLAISDPKEKGIRSWLTSGSFRIDGTSTSKHLVLKNVIQTELLNYQLYDFQRFALSSFETFAKSSSDPTRPSALGWPLLKAYYAGYFGGHALMRAAGQAIIRLESLQTGPLTTLVQIASGSPITITPGTFHLRLIQNPDLTIDVILDSMDETGGAHAVFWRAFCQLFLSDVNATVAAAGLPDANEVISKLGDLQELLRGKGSSAGTWLSQIRNRINYQHEYGVWFPFGVSRTEIRQVNSLDLRSLPNARLDFDHNKQTIQAFWAGCLFIARLSYDLSEILATQTTSKYSFVRNWRRLQTELGISF